MLIQARRDGFAIPMVILLIGVITAGVVGAFARVESENTVVTSADAQTRAYALAEAGIGQYLSDRYVPSPMDFDLPGGSAEVRVEEMRPDDGVNGTLYLIRSTGIPETGSAAAARHTVVQLAWLIPYTMSVPAGWTSLSGIRKDGTSGLMSGYDECGMSAAEGGVAVPTGGYSGHDSMLEGDPPKLEMGTVEDMADNIDIDWTNIVSGDALDFDIRIPDDPWPSADSFDARPDWWPVIYIDNKDGPVFDPADMDGRGTLIIRGDVDLDGGDEWQGIMLVGGRLVDNGTGAISGTVVSGLNLTLDPPESVEQSSRAHGTKTYRYNSCHIESALTAMSLLRPMRNTWIDNWAAY